MTTLKQKEARARNWKIFMLRAMYYKIDSMNLPKELAKKSLGVIDEILLYYGAKTEIEHRHERFREDV